MYCNRIDISEGTDVDKTSASKQCNICHYWYFLNYSLNSHQMSAMFHQHKRPTSIKNADVIKIVVSNKVSFWKKGFKYFIGYKDNKKSKPLCIFLP